MPNDTRRYAPVAFFSQLRRDLDELFQEMIATSESLGQTPVWRPATDVLELADAVLVVMEVPGLALDDLEVQAEGGVLRIHGRRQLCFPGPEPGRFHCLERQEGSFARQVEVAVPVNFAAARAELARGLLTIELPKLKDRRRRRHTIPITEDQEEE